MPNPCINPRRHLRGTCIFTRPAPAAAALSGNRLKMTVSKQSDKKSLRREKLLLRKSMAPDARYAADAAILKNLESLPEFAEASVIAAYASDGTEPDLMPLLRRAAGTGKTICLPRWLNDSNYEMAVLDGDFKTVSGKWNMPEPPPDAPPAETQLLERALWLVPGVAFDENCARLGRGKGIYDRLLAGTKGVSAGVFYDCQQTAGLPTEPHDRPLDIVVTESQVRRRKQ